MRYTKALPLTWSGWWWGLFGYGTQEYVVVADDDLTVASRKEPLMPTGAPAAGAHL